MELRVGSKFEEMTKLSSAEEGAMWDRFYGLYTDNEECRLAPEHREAMIAIMQEAPSFTRRIDGELMAMWPCEDHNGQRERFIWIALQTDNEICMADECSIEQFDHQRRAEVLER